MNAKDVQIEWLNFPEENERGWNQYATSKQEKCIINMKTGNNNNDSRQKTAPKLQTVLMRLCTYNIQYSINRYDIFLY